MTNRELLIRQNKGRRAFEEYRASLSKILKIELEKSNFLDLELTDEIYKKFYKTFVESPKVFNKRYDSNKLENLQIDVELLAIKFDSREGLLITKKSEICGALKINASLVFDNYMEILNFDGDSVNFLSLNDDLHFQLDCYEEYGNFFYELSVW